MPLKSSYRMLTLDDLRLVLNEIYSVRDKWYNLGLQLLVPVTELRKIESEHRGDDTTCLRQMLIKWLESGHANWRSLCDALHSCIVLGDNAALANTLMKKYCEAGEKEPSTKKRKLSEAATAATTKKPKVDLPDTFDPADFVNNPPDDRLCSKCRHVPTNPQCSACCGTLCCAPCSKTLPPSYCSLHQQQQRYVDNKSLRTKIMDLRSRCPNWRSGCLYKNAVSKVYRQHLPECKHQPGSSSNKVTFTAEKPLPKAEVKPVVPGTGPSTKSPTFGGLTEKKPKVLCKYHRIGCFARFVSESEMELHLREGIQYHLDLAIAKIEQLLEMRQ